MTAGLNLTWDALAKTRNRAVLPLLEHALLSETGGDRAHAIRCCVRRHDAESHKLLIRHFARLSPEDQAIACDAHRAMPHHMAAALKAAIRGSLPEFCDPACELIAESNDFELFPALVQAAENRQQRRLHVILSTIRRMAESLQRELADWLIDQEQVGRDPTFARRNALAALDRALAQYAKHQRRELLEPYLLLSPCDHAPLVKILRGEHHPSHRMIIDLLANNRTPGMVEKAVEFLRDTDAPTPALAAISRRSDTDFVQLLLSRVKHPVPLRVLHNMKRMSSVVWLEERRDVLLELDGRAQAVAVELAAASGLRPESLFELLALLLKGGLAEGRRASCNALSKFNTAQADELVQNALADPDAGVQAAAVRQLRRRGFPDALERLVALLDSRSTEVRDAARSSLAEFNFLRYRSMFDLLDENALKTTGVLVHKVDPAAREGLAQELNSPSVSAKLRGIEMAVAMDATQEVCNELLTLADSDNLPIRQEAIAALGCCHGPQVLKALRRATADPHPSVRESATAALRRLTGDNETRPEPAALTGDAK